MSNNKNDIRPLILVVDDVPENIEVILKILNNKNYSFAVATTGEEALNAMQAAIPDLILLDIVLPDFSGFELCKLLKQKPETREVPIIILSARSELSNKIKAFQLGAVDYVTKPFEGEEVLARVKTHVDLKKSKDIIEQQNKNLTQKQKEITDSLRFASHIQNVLLPSEKHISSLLKNHFVFFKPRNIIGGDFYWINKFDNKIFIAVGDCTGHGVPGAFMSVLGISTLNEVIEANAEKPLNYILDIVQNKISCIVSDNDRYKVYGMDLAILSWNLKTNKAEFSGAGIPLYVIRDGAITILKNNSFTIGYNYNTSEEFNVEQFKLHKKDRLYICSDGFSDQFGGVHDKKYMLKRFKKLLLDIQRHNMKKQHDLLKKEFLSWKKNTDQIDDVLVFGIEIT